MTIDLFGMKLTDGEIDRLGMFLLVLAVLGVIALFGINSYVIPSAAPSGSIKDYWMPTEMTVVLGVLVSIFLIIAFWRSKK